MTLERKLKKMNKIDKQLGKLHSDNNLALYILSTATGVTLFSEGSIASGAGNSYIENMETPAGFDWNLYYYPNGTRNETPLPSTTYTYPEGFVSHWVNILLQSGVTIAAAINIGIAYKRYREAETKRERIKNGLKMILHGGLALGSKLISWGTGHEQVDVAITGLNEGTGQVASYRNGAIISGVALGIEGACAIANINRLLKIPKRIVKLEKEKEAGYESTLDDIKTHSELPNYETTAEDLRKSVGELFAIRYSALANINIKQLDEILDPTKTKAMDMKTKLSDSVASGGYGLTIPDDETFYKYYMKFLFEGDLDPKSTKEIDSFFPGTLDAEISKAGLTYKQVLIGLNDYLPTRARGG